MKIPKTIMTTALLAAISAGVLQASTIEVHLTGSTAFRKGVHNAIAHILTSPTAVYDGSGGANIGNTTRATFKGTIGSDTYFFYTFWSGSASGLQTVDASTPITSFISSGDVNSGGGVVVPNPTGPTGGNVDSAITTVTSAPDAALSDTWAATTGVFTNIGAPVSSGGDPWVGVVPFEFVANKNGLGRNASTTANSTTVTVSSSGLAVGEVISGNPNIPKGAVVTSLGGSSITIFPAATASGLNVFTNFDTTKFQNVTAQLARALWFDGTGPVSPGPGNLQLSLFSGNSADSGVTVFATGRDTDSGTRAIFAAETGIGTFADNLAFPALNQWYPIDGGSNVIVAIAGVVADYEPTASAPPNPLYTTLGYVGGGTLANALGATNGAASTRYTGYLGISDAATAIAAGAPEQEYNGFYYSPQAVQEGQYSFWGYEHIYTRATGVPAGVATGVQTLADQIHNVDAAVAGLLESSLNVTRVSQDDGATIQHK